MADTFVECLVAKKTPSYAPVAKAAVIGGAVVFFMIGIADWLFLIPAVICIILFFTAIPGLNVEWEYTYLGDQINIDKIINKNSRKKMGEYEMSHIEIVAMKNSSEIRPFLENPNMKNNIIDYSTDNGDAGVYAFIYRGEKGQQIILFEPSEKMLAAMRYTAPRKVIIGC